MPAGVVPAVDITKVEMQVGEQDVVENKHAAPDGSPEQLKIIDCAVPPVRDAVTVVFDELP